MFPDDFRGENMTELDKLIRAESYIRKMANGINPITDETAADDDMVNNV